MSDHRGTTADVEGSPDPQKRCNWGRREGRHGGAGGDRRGGGQAGAGRAGVVDASVRWKLSVQRDSHPTFTYFQGVSLEITFGANDPC